MKCYIKDYPRPQFVRADWENLNGTWDFCFDDYNRGEKERWQEKFPGGLRIQVPFTYETKLSGIKEEAPHSNVWYRRSIQVDAGRLEQDNYILHFEGSDFLTKVWVNGRYVGSHRGGYARFSFDITNLVRDGENEIVVKVEDSLDVQQPRGKQRWLPESYGCFYVQTTGIWKTVWSEYVPKTHLSRVKMTPNMEDRCLEVEYEVEAPAYAWDGSLTVEAVVTFQGNPVCRNLTAVNCGLVRTKLDVMTEALGDVDWVVRTWTPERPNLYDVEFRLIKEGETFDAVGSYFAMREIRIDGRHILLNSYPLYQRLLLDQGYWKDSHLTPPSEEALIEDIDKIRAMGYNGVRKHQKVEDERFLYWCDVKGLLLWSEMAAAYRYSDNAVAEFTAEWVEILRQNYNHPCIIVWTPFNESWGISRVKTNRKEQQFTEAIYHLTKSMDGMRPVVSNDGWEHTLTDILTLHDYEEAGSVLKARYTEQKDELLTAAICHNGFKTALADGYGYCGQPVIISEYGGIAFDNNGDGWGYGNLVKSKEDFIRRFDDVTTAIKELPYVCGYCYTQVTDVQQEVNGLMDEERNFKVEPGVIREINERKVL